MASYACAAVLVVACHGTTKDGASDGSSSDSDSSAADTAPDCAGYAGSVAATDVAQTPRDEVEMEGIALCLSDLAVAPQEIYDRVSVDIPAARLAYSELSLISFSPWLDPHSLTFETDPSTLVDMQAGSFTGWDCVNSYYMVKNIDLRGLATSAGFGTITLHGYFDMNFVLPDYVAISGLSDVEVIPTGANTDNIVGVIDGDTYHYVFIDGYGDDCEAGCDGHVYYHVVSEAAGDPVLEDSWDSGSGLPKPEWVTDYDRCGLEYIYDD